MAYAETIGIFACTAVILACSLDLLMGISGLFSAATGVFYGLGAYTASLLWVHVSADLFLGLVGAAVVGSIVAIPFVVPALRSTSELTFVVASLAFASILSDVFGNWNSVTGGEGGLVGTPAPTIGSLTIGPGGGVLIVAIGVAVVCVLGKELLARSRWGLDLRASAQDAVAARSLAVGVVGGRVQVAVVASMMAAVAGVLYVAQVQFVNPSGFDVSESILVAAMVVMGGMSSMVGPLVGALLLTGIPAGLSFAPISPGDLGIFEQMFYGAILVAIMVLRPSGVMGKVSQVRCWLPNVGRGVAGDRSGE